VPVCAIKPTDDITTIEGLAGSVGKDLHPMHGTYHRIREAIKAGAAKM